MNDQKRKPGRKLKHGEKTTLITFRVPVGARDGIRKVVGDYLHIYAMKKLSDIINQLNK